jgi:hypothetical protein
MSGVSKTDMWNYYINRDYPEEFRSFPQNLRANSRIIGQMTSRLPPSTFSLLHYLPNNIPLHTVAGMYLAIVTGWLNKPEANYPHTLEQITATTDRMFVSTGETT